MSLLVRCALFSLCVLPAAIGSAQNWPQWRGPAGDGVAPAADIPVVWSERRTIVWQAPLPAFGASTPVIWGESIFLTGQDDTDLLLICLDKASGRVEWTEQVGVGVTVREAPKRSRQKFHNIHNLASPSCVTDGTVVICHFGNGDLAAYDFAGKQQWKRNLQDDHGQYTIWWGHANSPVIDGNLVISACMQDSLADISAEPAKSYLVAHDKRNGNQRWIVERDTGAAGEEGDSYTTPIFAEVHGRRQMIVMGGNQLDGYDPQTGRRLWFLPGLVGGRTVTGPVFSDGFVYATRGMRGKMIAVNLEESLPQDYWKAEQPIELSHRDIVWDYSTGTPDSCTPVVWEHLLFFVADDGIARCVDAKNGKLYWKERLAGGYKASPIAVDGRIYFLNLKGLTTVISASTRFNKVAENQLPAETVASPAVSGDRIFIRGAEALWCVGE
ncbi:MAG: PQQ-binding-like beta-propeller repeat protein [Pirellulales bacterium]